MLHERSDVDGPDRAGGPQQGRVGVKFACRGVDYRFTEPSPSPGGLAKVPGIYAVLVPDENCSPDRLRVLYFGQTDDLSSAVTEDNQRYKDWRRRARNRPLLLSVHALPPDSSEQERRQLELGFIAAYQPICNQRW